MIVLHSNHPELLKGQKVWPYHDDDAIVVGKVRIIKPDITLHEREEEMSIEGFCYLCRVGGMWIKIQLKNS